MRELSLLVCTFYVVLDINVDTMHWGWESNKSLMFIRSYLGPVEEKDKTAQMGQETDAHRSCQLSLAWN